MAGLSLKSKEKSIVSSSHEQNAQDLNSDESVCPLVTEAIEYQNSKGFGKVSSSESQSKDKNEEMVDFLNKNLAKSMANLGGKDLDDEGGSSQEISQELIEEMADTTTNL